MPTDTFPAARRIWDAVEPIASQVYFAPEAHRAYQSLGFDGPSRVIGGVEFPDRVAYFTSRGACLGPHVDGHVVAAAFAVFKLDDVVDAVAEGWRRTDQQAILAARQQSAQAFLQRVIGEQPEGLAWATGVLRRMVDAATGEGRALFSGLRSLGVPDEPIAAFWRLADLVREHRGDSHIAAWINADLDAAEIGLLTDPWRGLRLRSWVRSRGWTDDELDAACDRLRSRGLLDGDEVSERGLALREEIEVATDRMERRVVEALGDDAEQLFGLMGGWSAAVFAAGGYPGPVRWPPGSASTG